MDWTELTLKTVGYGGQLCFGLRFLVQWIASEREKRTIVPAVFWYLSILGSVLLLVYGLWRRDDVIVVGQTGGIVVYVRNLVLRARAPE